MKTIQAYIKRHPLLSYYVLTFAISWGAVLVMIAFSGMPRTAKEMETFMPVVIPAQLLGPSVSGLLMIGLVDGRAGYRGLWSRLRRWRAGIHWYAIAVLAGPLIVLGVVMGLFLALSPVYLPGLFTRDDEVFWLIMGLSSGIVTGICEELGWVGFVTPRLRQRYSVLTTGLIMGFLWGLWHLLPMAIWPSVALSAPQSPALYIAIRTVSFLFGGLVAFRILMLWVYDRTQSLPVMMVMHAGLTAANIIFMAEAATGTYAFIHDLVGASVQWIVVAVVLLANHEQLSRSPLKMQAMLLGSESSR
jgi:membrane protease YdiL (CAAX protease family)